MLTRKRGVASLAGIVTIALAATACGGSSSPTPGSSSSSSGTAGGFQKLAPNSGGTPTKGGVLNALGVGDVDYMDPNITYYTIGQSAARLYSRQLYSYTAKVGHWTDSAPDLATGEPNISSDGKTYKITIKQGAMWNTTPKRQVTAADFARGVKTTCNPAQPFGGLPDYESYIEGLQSFCDGFAKVGQTASAIKSYMDSHEISGVSADPADPQTVVIKLTQPVSFFRTMLTMTAFTPRPKELEAYVPASAQEAQHTISDGPYEIKSYNPGKSIDFVRNPAWDASTDSLRKAYVDEIKINETGDQNAIQQQLQTNSPTADLDWDTGTPATAIPGLLAQNDPNLNIQSEIATNPYVLFNTVSGPLAKKEVRQAISYAISRQNLIQAFGGPQLNPALTHVLPAQIKGGEQNFDLYPYDINKAKQLLQAAGVTNLTLKFLYRPASASQTKMFQTLQADLKKVGITVKGLGVPPADFYTKYLESPGVARRHVWDISGAGWGPDWYGDAALSFFGPLFDGRVLPPSSSNFGLYNNPKVGQLIDQAKAASTESQSSALWAQADKLVMQDAAFYPITNPNTAYYHGSQVHNCIVMPMYQTADFSNVWLESGKNGG
jgi:peptide/nickel transport system substrate-binding protein